MDNKNLNRIHYCSTCDSEMETKQLLSGYRCKTCCRFTSPHTKMDYEIKQLWKMAYESKVISQE